MSRSRRTSRVTRLNFEFRTEADVNITLLLQELTSLRNTRMAIVHSVALAVELYKCKVAGGKTVMIAKDGTKTELELL